MHPVLFHIGSFPVRSYGLMLIIGVLVGLWMAYRRAPRYGINPDKLADLMIWLLLPGILMARATFILLNWSDYAAHPEQIWTIQFQGLTSFGGFIGGFLGFLGWVKFSKTPFWRAADLLSVPWLVGNAIGRVGCLLNGCCYGHQTDAPWGVHVEGLAHTYEPAQIYESILCLVAAYLITLAERKRLDLGKPFALSLIGFGASRFIYEFWRAGTEIQVAAGQATSEYMGGLPITQAQVMAGSVVITGIIVYLFRRNRPTADAVPEEQTA